MKKLIKITLVLMLTFAATPPLFAGMEPFWRGEWGMSAEEIKQLYAISPEHDYSSNLYETREIEFKNKLYEQPTQLTFAFKSNDEGGLFGVVIAGLTLKESSPQDFEKFISQITADIQSAKPGTLFKRSDYTKNNQQYSDIICINEDTCIFIKAKKLQTEMLSDYHISLRFFNNADNRYNKNFEYHQDIYK